MDRRGSSRAYGKTRPVRLLAVAGAALLALLASGCGSTGEDNEAAAEPSKVSHEQLTDLPEATTFGELTGAPEDPGTEDTGKVVHPKQDMAVYDSPGGEPFARLPAQQISSPTWAPVVAEQGDWVQVLLPARPNGSSGWIHAGGDAVEEAKNNFAVTVHRDDYKLEITEDGESIG